MKIFTLTFVVLFFSQIAFSQNVSQLPKVNLKTLHGQSVSTDTLFQNDGNPIVISFWATWCKPCIKELKAVSDYYADWQDETGVKIFAISIDDSKTDMRVVPMVNTFGWEYEIILDKNSDLKRAMNVVSIPHTFIIDGKGNIIHQHTMYYEGIEDTFYDEILEASQK